MHALQNEEDWEGWHHLTAVWNDAQGRAEEGAVFQLVDHILREREGTGQDDAFDELRRTIARAWLDRGDRERARAQVARIVRDEEDFTLEMTTALDGTEAARRLAGSQARFMSARSVIAEANARWGDRAEAERELATWSEDEITGVAIALANRDRREGAPGGSRWLAAAERALAASEVTESEDMGTLTIGLVRALLAAGEKSRAVAVLNRLGSAHIGKVCGVIHEGIDVVDPLLFDALLLRGTQIAAADSLESRQGCPGVLAELAARRGDRPTARRLLDWANRYGDGASGPDRGFDFTWSVGVRLERNDPLLPGAVGKDVFRALLLARILDDVPDARVDLSRLTASITLPAPEVPPHLGDDAADDAEEESEAESEADDDRETTPTSP